MGTSIALLFFEEKRSQRAKDDLCKNDAWDEQDFYPYFSRLYYIAFDQTF